ncbi:AAA family ATPase [Ktedonobacteria bacterium brp13]|nr:AAA family ATPase [Ktedonobacteria bacterium brp13]
MKLRTLEIGAFKNLRTFAIDFEDTLTTVLLGQNGTGKSNLLEAVIIIFRDLDLGQPPEFQYKLHYECRGNEIHIDADPARAKRDQVLITIRNPDTMVEAIPYTRFHSGSDRHYLPSYVFGYYSGPSNRMEKHFNKHQDRFYRDLLRGEEKSLRPLLYARPVHSQFVLLSFFIEEEHNLAEGEQSIRDFLDELLGIQELSSVLFVMRKPPWTSKNGDPRFWNARGVVGSFLTYLYDLALAPMRLNVRVTPEFASQTTLEHLYLYLQNVEDLKRLFEHYNDQQAFFKALESTYISKVLSEVRIRLRRRNADGSLTFRDLSEGEQQLLMVLGLLRFTKQDQALFLLDEPDTHLNPAWSMRYLEFMRRIVGDQPSSQVIMTTHNPMVIAALKRQDVRIMQRNTTSGHIYVDLPREDPQGMGVAGILTSDLFGLRSSLDLPTQKLLDEQRVLAAKDTLTQPEARHLGELTDRLDDLGFMTAEDDPIYAEFIKRFTAREDKDVLKQVVLTYEQRKERERLTDEIIDELIAEGYWR